MKGYYKNMLNKIKKGFTIVELVIVIAVIAILAGVLIPTFSSVTKNAKQSAAMQQAKNAMESTLALTGGSYTTGTDFIVSEEESGKIAYWFEYSGNKLNDVTDKDHATAEYITGEYYAAYFSTKCFSADNAENTIVNDIGTIDADKEYKTSLATLMEAINVSDANYNYALVASAASNLKADNANGYFTVKFTAKADETDVKTVRIYYTPDIEASLIIVLGANK